jgi:protein ImuB
MTNGGQVYPETSIAMSYAAIGIPRFALQAALRSGRDVGDRVVVLMDETSRRARVVSLSASATGYGIRAGMTAPQVVARCPRAEIVSRSPDGEAAAAALLLRQGRSLAPRAACVEPGLCLVDLDGVPPKRRERQPREIVAALRREGLSACIGMARTSGLARLAWRRAEPVLEVTDEKAFVSDFPIRLAGLSPAGERLLRHWGMRTLGAFAALSRQAVAERLGTEGLALWDGVNGRDGAPLQPEGEEEVFEARVEFETGVETLDPVRFHVQNLVERLMGRLRAGYLAVEEVMLELGQEYAAPLGRRFRLPEPATREDVVLRTLGIWLESLKSERRVTGVYMQMLPGRMQARQGDLFEAGMVDARRLAETLANLTAVAGADRVGSPGVLPTHRPDAFRMEPFDPSGSRIENAVTGALLMPTPRRFRPPLPVAVTLNRGCPLRLTGAFTDGEVAGVRGPWRLSGDWWREDRWWREEWDVELQGGGVYLLVRGATGWRLEGMYD